MDSDSDQIIRGVRKPMVTSLSLFDLSMTFKFNVQQLQLQTCQNPDIPDIRIAEGVVHLDIVAWYPNHDITAS